MPKVEEVTRPANDGYLRQGEMEKIIAGLDKLRARKSAWTQPKSQRTDRAVRAWERRLLAAKPWLKKLLAGEG